MKKIFEWFINLYAVWIILAFVTGYLYPEAFMWFTRGSWMTYALAVVMLSMGLTLRIEDFKALFKTPRVILIASSAQYTILPVLGWLIATTMGLPTEFAVGLIIVACCPAGTASNMIAYIARANVALSVTSTAISTILGIFMTPLLTMFFAGQLVHVDALGMFLDVIKIVLIPVTLGVFLRYKYPKFIEKLGQTGPVISTWAIVFISGGIIAPAMIEGKNMLIQYAGQLILAATILHSLGFGLGYAYGRVFKYDAYHSKAISCETGMQNGGLAAVLARNNFPMLMPLVAVPAVFCSVMQTVIGGILATIWRFRSKPENKNINDNKR
ncbi:MAG: bile acid:sodium symporter family protein [Oscillospiraceae bacterium]|nr:bile acid:sodium symporter family protein [Oscillospiraceae bacterium]